VQREIRHEEEVKVWLLKQGPHFFPKTLKNKINGYKDNSISTVELSLAQWRRQDWAEVFFWGGGG
jgi:hypothetical protein